MSNKKIYLDACCFIELVLANQGQNLVVNGGEYVWRIQALLRAARDKKIAVVSSMLTIAECVSAKGDVSEKVQYLFRGLLTSGTSGVTPWQVDMFVLERARELRWKHQINLKPADSIHVATALEAECDEFLTWDGEGGSARSILKFAPALQRLGLTVLTPANTQCIPDEYKQQRMPLEGAGNKPE